MNAERGQPTQLRKNIFQKFGLSQLDERLGGDYSIKSLELLQRHLTGFHLPDEVSVVLAIRFLQSLDHGQGRILNSCWALDGKPLGLQSIA